MTNPIVVERMVDYRDGKPARRHHYYWCPGCDSLHGISIRPDVNGKGAGWEFTGTIECPTYAPSQLTTWNEGPGTPRVEHRCHTFIRAGRIEYLTDCTHALAGQTVSMVPLPDWFVEE